MGFSRRGYWSGLLFPSPSHLWNVYNNHLYCRGFIKSLNGLMQWKQNLQDHTWQRSHCPCSGGCQNDLTDPQGLFPAAEPVTWDSGTHVFPALEEATLSQANMLLRVTRRVLKSFISHSICSQVSAAAICLSSVARFSSDILVSFNQCPFYLFSWAGPLSFASKRVLIWSLNFRWINEPDTKYVKDFSHYIKLGPKFW